MKEHDKVICCKIYQAANVSFCQRQLFFLGLVKSVHNAIE